MKYQLKLLFSFEASDTPHARDKAAAVLASMGIRPDDELFDIKLQKLPEGKPPEGIRWLKKDGV